MASLLPELGSGQQIEFQSLVNFFLYRRKKFMILMVWTFLDMGQKKLQSISCELELVSANITYNSHH